MVPRSFCNRQSEFRNLKWNFQGPLYKKTLKIATWLTVQSWKTFHSMVEDFLSNAKTLLTNDWKSVKKRNKIYWNLKSKGILNTVFSVALKSGVFPTRWKVALKSRVFPTRWKVAQLLLFQKPGKPAGNPTSFRPLCMPDLIGKIREQFIAKWLRKHFWGKHALSTDQYRFCAGCSMINAAGKLEESSLHRRLRSTNLTQLSALIYNNFLKIFSSFFKVSLKFFQKLFAAYIFINYTNLLKFVKIVFRRIPKFHQIIKHF